MFVYRLNKQNTLVSILVKGKIEGHVAKYRPGAVISAGASGERVRIKLERFTINSKDL